MATLTLAPTAASPSPSPVPAPASERQSLVSNSSLPYQTITGSSIHTSPSSSPNLASSAGTREPPHLSGSKDPERFTDSPVSASPLHIISQSSSTGSARAQEVHIIKVTEGAAEMQAGAHPQSVRHKIGEGLMCVVDGHDRIYNHSEGSVGPPPPSPPASEEHISPIDSDFPEHRVKYQSTPPAPSVSFDPSASKDHRHAPPSSFTGSSATGRTSTSTTGPRSHPFPSDDTSMAYSVSAPADDRSSLSYSQSSRLHGDGLLHPPAAHASRPSRRNTTGSAAPYMPAGKPRMPVRGQSTLGLQDAAVGDGALEDDIEQQAEQIRRERLSKRVKAQKQAEAALTAPRREGADDNSPLVGNLIGENHVNYVLMYNMLTGIRIAVSRSQAKIRRPLVDEDFTARHKYSFDIIGNELTPSAKYDFKFKDYAPSVFRELREDSFHLDPADYLLSLTAKYILSELGSPGKSGSFFYFSRDYRFIIKTIHHSEHKYLRSILPQYYKHVRENPHTLLSRFYGLHRVKLPRGRKIHFVIMNNLFPPHKDIHETYDLKGSTVGRLYPEEKARENPRAVLKDLNWIGRRKSLELGPEKRALLTEQLRRDSEFLKKLWVMDYSLLVGIHNMQRGNRDNVRRNTLKVFSPDMPVIRRKLKSYGSSPEAIAMRRAMRASDPKRLGLDTLQLPEVDTGDRQHFIFYQDDGGLQATDEQNEPLDTIYYLGVIDILTPYSTFKKIEHFWKGLSADRHKISPVPPTEYADRFFAFMKSIMRGGGGSERLKAE